MKNAKAFVLTASLSAAIMTLVGCANIRLSDVEYNARPQCDLVRPSDAVVLFDGGDFSQWLGEDAGPVKWKIIDGAMQVVPDSGSIVTRDTFQDMRLHVEFNIPKSPGSSTGQSRGNSGIYIQRRYEVQILDSFGLQPDTGDCGAIYKTKTPDKNVCKKPGEWQSYDIFFRAPRWAGENKIENARITVLQNGIVIHNNVILPHKTGAGQGEGPTPGPVKLQEHGSNVKFRNIWIVPLD